MLDKENIRKWLLDKGFFGKGAPPKLSDNIRITLAERYIELYYILTGKQFQPIIGDVKSRIKKNLKNVGVSV